MRASILVALVLLVSGCSFTSSDPDPVRAARVAGTTVEALDLETVWDRDIFGPNGPEVYVEIRRIDTTRADGSVSAFRTESQRDVERASLPLTLQERAPLFGGSSSPISLDERVFVVVYDDDTVGLNDLMFASDTLRLRSTLPAGAVVGDERLATFEGDGTRVRLRLRWE